MGKILAEFILQRLQSLLVGEIGLSENQFGFRKGTLPQMHVEKLASIRDSARWSELTYAMRSIPRDGRSASRLWCRRRFQDYLLRMIGDYLSNRWVIYEGEKWSLKEDMTCGAPQVSRVGPTVWNVIYDDFLPLELPIGTSIIGFADDGLVVCAAEDVKILELRIIESLCRAKLWLDSRGLKMVTLIYRSTICELEKYPVLWETAVINTFTFDKWNLTLK